MRRIHGTEVVESLQGRERTQMGISVGAVFKPGDKVLRSGVYRVAHGETHSREHDVTCIYGMTFPYCNECGASCQFTLRMAAQDIAFDQRFVATNTFNDKEA